jgi:hypothetical protein
MKNVSEPPVVYQFTDEELEGVYYSFVASSEKPMIEVSKRIVPANPLEQCAMALIHDEVQVQLFSGEEMFRAVAGRINRYMIYEVGGVAIERITIDVDSTL